MKKILTWALLLAMILSLFAGCNAEAEPTQPSETQGEVVENPTEAVPVEDTNLENAIAYLRAMYKDAGGLTPGDFQRLSTIRVADVPYEVVYTVDCDESVVKIVPGTDGMVTIDVNEESEEEVPYVLTATMTGTDGKTATLSWNHVVPVSMSSRGLEIVDAAYELEAGAELGYEATLTGVITAIDTPYSTEYKNITVIIQVEGREDKPIMCYRLKGEGAENLAVGDTITVTGSIKNYKGTIEFDAGCTVDKIISGGGSSAAPTDPAEILAAAFALEQGESLPYYATLTGIITSVDDGYNPKYNNVTVKIAVQDKIIVCFRMKGEGADKLDINDEITVTGTLTNYYTVIEFNAGCTLDKVVKGTPPCSPADPLKHIDNAYNLEPGFALPYHTTLTGIVTSIDSPYSSSYGNITVTMTVPGREDKPIKCYRLKGENADKIGVGDEITVIGWLMNYKGTIEYTDSCVMHKWIDNPDPVQPKDPQEIIDAAYALEPNTALAGEYTLTGTITSIKTPYDSSYKNISVVIDVDGADKDILCYRLKGSGAENLKVGDRITVTGAIKKHYDTVEFDAGCTFVPADGGAAPELKTPQEIIDAAYALAQGESFQENVTLSGTILSVDTAYSTQYKNLTVTIDVDGADKNIQCFRLKGDGAENLKVGDAITVTGIITNYSGKIQFNAGCTFTSNSGETPDVPEVPELKTPQEIIDAAYALEKDTELGTYTLVGYITKIDTAYSEQYKNVSVTIDVDGADKDILCFRMKGEGADALKVGDHISVTGKIKNYNGTVEYDAGCTFVLIPETAEPDLNTPQGIVDAAYALEDGAKFENAVSLTGTINKVNTAYSAQFKNVTVTIDVDGADKDMLCYRIKGDGADALKVGDKITVTGIIKNYMGTIEFDAGSTFVLVSSAPAEPEDPNKPGTTQEIVDAAFALKDGESLSGTYTLTGVVTKVSELSSYNDRNVHVSIDGTDKVIYCYALKGDGIVDLKVGDHITVTGSIKNYKGTVEFDLGCTFVPVAG